MHVLFNLECRAGLFHAHADVHIQVLGFVGGFFVILAPDGVLRVVGILHPRAGIFLVEVNIDKTGNEVLVQVLDCIILAAEVHHWASLQLLVDHIERGHAGSLGDRGVIGTECGCDVNDTRTVFGGHIVTVNDAETIVVAHNLVAHLVDGLYPREQLLKADIEQVSTLELSNYLPGYHLVARCIIAQRLLGALSLEVGTQAGLSEQVDGRTAVIGIVALNGYIVNLRSDAQCCVAGQGPGGCRPGQDGQVVKSFIGLVQDGANGRMVILHYGELSGDGLVLDIAVATGHVQLVRAQTCASSGRIGLDGVALV